MLRHLTLIFGGADKVCFEYPPNTFIQISIQSNKTTAELYAQRLFKSNRNNKMQARLPPLELPRSGSQGSAVILTTLSARLLRAPLRALAIQLLRLLIVN